MGFQLPPIDEKSGPHPLGRWEGLWKQHIPCGPRARVRNGFDDWGNFWWSLIEWKHSILKAFRPPQCSPFVWGVGQPPRRASTALERCSDPRGAGELGLGEENLKVKGSHFAKPLSVRLTWIEKILDQNGKRGSRSYQVFVVISFAEHLSWTDLLKTPATTVSGKCVPSGKASFFLSVQNPKRIPKLFLARPRNLANHWQEGCSQGAFGGPLLTAAGAAAEKAVGQALRKRYTRPGGCIERCPGRWVWGWTM